MENTSGQGSAALVPPEIDRWNWGAFLLNWIWGIGNNTFIALLMFVPLVNVVMAFVLGAKGSTWAWRNKRWESIDQFKQIQKKWAVWSLIIYALLVALFVGLFFLISALLKNSDAYQLGLTKLQANPEAMAVLGPPISTGMVQGSIQTSGPTGSANISFSVKGQSARGTLYLDAKKDLGQWKANRIELEIDGRQSRIDLNR